MTSQVEPVPVPDCQVPTPPCVRLRTAQSSRLPNHPGTCVGLAAKYGMLGIYLWRPKPKPSSDHVRSHRPIGERF